MARAPYSFPSLKPSEILNCLSDVHVHMSEEQLSTPEKHKEAIRRAYEQLVEACTGTTREEMTQMPFDAMQMLEYASLHEDSVPTLCFLRSCQKLMYFCGIGDFTIKDLTQPTSKRLKKHLSAVINFMKFKEERLPLFKELNEQQAQALELLERAHTENTSLTRQLGELRDQIAAETKVVTSVEEENCTLKTRISSLNLEQTILRQDSAEAKRSADTLKEELTKLSVVFEEKKAQRKRLQSQIVKSPERFRREVEDAARSLAEEQTEARATEKNAREAAAKLADVTEALKEVRWAMSLLEDVNAEVDKNREVAQQLLEKKEALRTKQRTLHEINAETETNEQNLHKLEQKLSAMRKQSRKRAEELHKELEQTQQNLVQAEEKKRAATKKGERAQAEMQRLARVYEQEERLMQEERRDMVQAYKRMEKLAMAHLHSLQEKLCFDCGPCTA